VAETFTGSPGKYVSLKDTIRGFKGIIDGEYDHLPEQAFYMVGSIEEAAERALADRTCDVEIAEAQTRLLEAAAQLRALEQLRKQVKRR
jgi:hypothetical protein